MKKKKFVKPTCELKGTMSPLLLISGSIEEVKYRGTITFDEGDTKGSQLLSF